MKRVEILYSGLFITTLLALIGCGPKVPTLPVWQPWTRELRTTEEIQLGSTFKVEVAGQTLPLLGDETLLKNELKKEAEQLLARRGFIIQDGQLGYTMLLTYKTERSDKLESFEMSRSFSSYYASSALGSSYGLGTSIALAVGTAAMRSGMTTVHTTKEERGYSHTISLEILNPAGQLIWKGESSWDSENLDVVSDSRPALQLLLSHLPSDPLHRPAVEEVKQSHAKNYYHLVCENKRFSCPALPYRIYFAYNINILNNEAMAANVDLLRTAEFAVPVGDEDWSDPIWLDLWKKVMLGGKYFLGPEKKPINVLIKIRGSIPGQGENEGYYVTSCWVASDEEYAQFQEKLSRWQQALKDYYDVFKH